MIKCQKSGGRERGREEVLLSKSSGSWSLKAGTAAMHCTGLAHTGKVSTTSPTAAASRMLTWRGKGRGGEGRGGGGEGSDVTRDNRYMYIRI